MQLPADAGLDTLDEVEIDDLLAVRTKEPRRIESLLEASLLPKGTDLIYPRTT